jgi:hypothetical protein
MPERSTSRLITTSGAIREGSAHGTRQCRNIGSNSAVRSHYITRQASSTHIVTPSTGGPHDASRNRILESGLSGNAPIASGTAPRLTSAEGLAFGAVATADAWTAIVPLLPVTSVCFRVVHAVAASARTGWPQTSTKPDTLQDRGGSATSALIRSFRPRMVGSGPTATESLGKCSAESTSTHRPRWADVA